MKTTRRKFITSAVVGGVAAASALPFASCARGGNTSSFSDDELQDRFDKLDAANRLPVFKKELFSDPVIIESVDLLEYNNVHICRVRSKDGAEGISVAHTDITVFIPIFQRRLRSFFIGQDARELDALMEMVEMYNLNFRLYGIALGLPLATIEFAILDMMGKIANKSAGQLVGEVLKPNIGVYMATEFRELPLEEHFERLKEEVAQCDFKALKLKVGFMWGGNKDIHYKGIPGKSEKLIPMIREHYGDDWTLYADANGYYNVDEAIKIGRLLEENKYAYFEEPVMFNHFADIKKVADALTIPIANGEQDQGAYNFKWLLAHDGIDIVEPDLYYFGGFIRSMKVALMAKVVGKSTLTHMSGGGLGFLYNALFVSVMPNSVEHTEFKGFQTRVPYECPTTPMEIVNGIMKAPSGPGMGAVIDPDFIAKLQLVER